MREVLLAALVSMSTVMAARAATYVAKPEIGTPAGLIPDCPGVLKNSSIGSRNLPNFQLVLHRLSPGGSVVRKAMPITAAARMVAKDKLIDLHNRKTMVYAVGFMDSSVWPHNQALATAYVKRGYNAFVTETMSFLTYIYPKSARLSKEIGRRLGQLLVKLTEQGLEPQNLELVGLSLGAHIAGYAAKYYYKKTGKKPSRVTGLDPAGPCFRNLPPEHRLSETDGERVDIIHTNIDGFGMAERIGHVDFYANGGEFQPGDVPQIPCLVICSHLKAIIYWWQAIEHPKKFIGIECDSVQNARYGNCFNGTVTNYLGHDTDFNKTGIFYLPTSNEFPYYRGTEGLKAENEIYRKVLRKINEDDEFVAK